MGERRPYILNIQKYCVHDGDGIRTTVFFKGCELRCKWCHNPESQAFEPSEMVYEERGERELVGRQYDLKELVRLLERDMPFYEQSGGGVTLSGGEVMQQEGGYVLSLAKTLFERGISVNIDTCGFAPWERFENILPYVDTFLYDLKHIDGKAHEALTGVDNTVILDNLRRLLSARAKVNLRLPIIPGANADDAAIMALAKYLRETAFGAIEKLSLLPYHKTGSEKYARLGAQATLFEVPSDEDMERIKGIFYRAGFVNVGVGA